MFVKMTILKQIGIENIVSQSCAVVEIDSAQQARIVFLSDSNSATSIVM